MPDIDEDERMREGRIDAALDYLTTSIGCAEEDILVALGALSDLHTYYAIGYVEHTEGSDIRRHLEDAARGLRAAHALHNEVARRSGKELL